MFSRLEAALARVELLVVEMILRCIVHGIYCALLLFAVKVRCHKESRLGCGKRKSLPATAS